MQSTVPQFLPVNTANAAGKGRVSKHAWLAGAQPPSPASAQNHLANSVMAGDAELEV
jgi:hypothetical protein